ncbi:MAG: DUF2934 domain-containing protein [Planctomycetes bacterium]|nr:DUF2934 domain-containing protein [Planctomycetota bacterium]
MSRSTTSTGATAQTGKATQTTPMASQQSCATTQACVPLEKIAMRAYQKWVQRGCMHGCDQQDWLEAEAELKAEMARGSAKK